LHSVQPVATQPRALGTAVVTRPARGDDLPLPQLALVEGIFIVVAGVIIHLRHASGAIAPRFPIAAELAIGLLLGAASGVLVGTGLLRSRLGEPVVRSLVLAPVIAKAVGTRTAAPA